MHIGSEPDLMVRNDIRHLADEARQTAARAVPGSAEHDFYSGVLSAAEHHLHPGLMAVDDLTWLDREAPAFRDGYLEASTLIGLTSASPGHLPLPVCRD